MNLNYSYKNDQGSNHEITDFEKQKVKTTVPHSLLTAKCEPEVEFDGTLVPTRTWQNRVLDHIFSVSKFLKLSFCRFEWTKPSEEIKQIFEVLTYGLFFEYLLHGIRRV
ncbi:unnamed protein product [Rhizophagus irregularis]|nr:unnamed protein product [Rhizophagus irregularis]